MLFLLSHYSYWDTMSVVVNFIPSPPTPFPSAFHVQTARWLMLTKISRQCRNMFKYSLVRADVQFFNGNLTKLYSVWSDMYHFALVITRAISIIITTTANNIIHNIFLELF